MFVSVVLIWGNNVYVNFDDDKCSEFIDVGVLILNVVLDICYFGYYNFVGKFIDGYNVFKCLLYNSVVIVFKKV